MKKRLVAFLLVLIMVLGMLPVSAFAADDGVSPQALESNETQTIKYQILYVGDEFNTGYNYGVSVNKTYTCQYSTGHSGFNHSILISEFRNVGVPALKGQLDSGYEFVGWAKEAKKNPTIFDFNTAGTTATQTTYTIYLVAKKTNPTPTYMYYLYYKYNDGTDSTWLTDVTDRPTAATTFTFNVNRAKLTRSGYDHIGWADKADAVTAKYTGGDPIVLTKDNPTKTIYAVWEGSDPIPVPSYDDLKSAIGKIQVKDVSTPSCGTENYDLIDNTQSEPFNWTKTARLDQPGKYDVTIKTAPYVAKYNSEKSKTHELNNANQTTLKLVISYENNTWKLDDGLRVIEVKHSEQTPPTDKPDKPTKNDVTGVVVDIVCVTTTGTHDTVQYPLGHPTDAQHTIGEVVSDGAGGYICPVTVRTAWFVQQASNLVWKVQHTPTAQTITFNLTYDKNSKTWVKPAANPRIEATHEVTPPRKPALNEGSPVCVQCEKTNSIHVQNGKDYARMYFGVSDSTRYTEVLKDGKNVWKDDNGVWTYQIKLKKDKYIEAVNTTPLINSEHTDLYPDQDAYVTWKRDGNQWKIVPVSPNQSGIGAVINVTCKLKAPTADELKKLDMAVQVKCVVDAAQQHTSAYGLLGEYDKDYFVGEPKKVGDDWLCDISYDPDPYVAAFNKAFPTPKHIQNDEKIVPVTLIWVGGSWQIKTQGRVLVTEVYTVTFDSYGGTPVPPAQEVEYGLTATEPAAPEKTGYTFDGWYLGDEKYDFSAAVEQNITLTAKWHVTPHNIYAYARLNSYFAPLTTSEFDTPITLNDATLSRLGLGSYNSLGYISIGSFDFDAMPLTSDLYFGDDAELSAVAEKLATDIALETGVSDKIAEKIAWTALYKTVNEEDMEPGYPAEAGYQLSGNLNLASVTFRAGAENVENMPAVNYTYDDGAIDFYDFYFAGDTITLPTTEPTREGYSFKGWSVEVIPAENDADHLDADGADDAADETLLKAGDTYTITAGGVIFTAQWEKKTFTVKYYLPDETGAWVEKKMDTVDSVDYATYSLWTPNAEDGYEFSGWYQKPADIGVKAKVEKLYMAKEWKLYGKFTPIEYTIQYVYNDGKATSTNPTTYTVESDTITLADATGADWGKTFLEWHDENGQKITEIPTGSTGDRVITAYWNWPVHLHYLDKDNNEIESATLYVSELEPGACVLPTGEKTGYDFDGWYEAKKDIGTASHKLNALSIAKKWELYGRYTAKTDVSYTVKYLREGDNKVLAPEKVVTDQTFDTEVTEQAADVVGYTPDAPSKTMILDEYNKVLTFSYSANTYDYTVRHIKQLPDGSYDEANAEVETLSGKFEALAAVTAKDYGEHYPTNDADTKQNIKIEEGLTIDVKYDLDEHTLTFETNGGSAINPVTVRHGNAVARPADPTKDKYTFIGWYADPEFTEEYDFATVLEADKTIYAKFELTSTPIGDIYVRYDVLHIKQLPDGTYDLANAEVEHLSAKKDTTVTAVIKDYRATHHVNVNRTLSKLTGTAIQPYKGVDGKPVYTILSVYYDLDFHTLTFDTMGGSKIAPETVRHGLTVAKPKDPVNGGYIFDGWYTDKTYRTPYNFATPLTQDTTIYAKWFLIVLPGVTDKKATPKLNTSDHFAYVQGYPNGTVKPAGNITRAETAAILFRLMDDASRKTYYSTKSGFRDVASGSWYNTYVATLNNAGVITDSSNGYFRPNEAITRAELAAMLAKFSETTSAANYFNDVSAKYWAANAIAICAKLGWITGYPDGTFRPDKNVTRAELMAMINRATGRAPKSADAFLPGMKTWIDNTSDKWYYLDVQEATNSHSYTVKGSETWTALTSDPNWSLYE